MQELEVRLGGERRPAVADVALVGPAHIGDEVIVNVAALDLELGSGGFDIVHVNLTRGLDGAGDAGRARDEAQLHEPPARRHAGRGERAGGRAADLPTGAPVAICVLHGQLAPLAWAFGQAAPGARLGYVQTAGGALPGGLSETVRAAAPSAACSPAT